MSTKSDILDLRVVLHAETDAAIKVSETGEADKAVWLPKSQIEFEPVPAADGRRCVDVQIPQWLAEVKRLV